MNIFNVNIFKFTTKSAALLAIISTAITPLSAQSYHPSQDYGMRDVRAGASIVIPFGGNRNDIRTKPRVEFSFQQSRIQQDQLKLDFNRYSLQDDPITNPNIGRIGITLDKNPTMMINGQIQKLPDDQKNISTLGVLGITAGAIVVLLGASLIVIANNSGDGDGA